MNVLVMANLIHNGDQCSAEMAQLHVCYFVKDVLTTADFIQQHHHISALVDTILKTSANETGHHILF